MKQTVAVVMGGPSAEHQISLQSGAAMLANIGPNYQAIKIVITKDGRWLWEAEEQSLSLGQAMRRLVSKKAIVLIALHGSYGEDGTLQAILEKYKIAYTGSGVAASLMAMDKNTSQEIYADCGLVVPKSLAINNRQYVVTKQVLASLPLPVVVKPARQGSSVGVHIVNSLGEFEPAVDDAFKNDQQIIVQQFIAGRELSCGVLQIDGQLKALPPTEIRPLKADFFDYKSKYEDGGSEVITPAKIPAQTTSAVQEIALRAHQALGCEGYSRTDVIWNDQGIYVIETNTLPGMTEHSILPQQAKAAGISLQQLLENLLGCTAGL